MEKVVSFRNRLYGGYMLLEALILVKGECVLLSRVGALPEGQSL